MFIRFIYALLFIVIIYCLSFVNKSAHYYYLCSDYMYTIISHRNTKTCAIATAWTPPGPYHHTEPIHSCCEKSLTQAKNVRQKNYTKSITVAVYVYSTTMEPYSQPSTPPAPPLHHDHGCDIPGNTINLSTPLLQLGI